MRTSSSPRSGAVARVLPLLLWLGALAHGTVAGAQPVHVDEPAVCYQCHDEIQDLAGSRSVHTAFRDGKCSSCHNPHASRHATLLNDDTGRLCLTCHDEIGAELELPSAHQPARGGDCTVCHDPHASAVRGQLVERVPALCQSCHQTAKDWLREPVVHAPVADGDCAACHERHGSANPTLLESGLPDLCFGCHDRNAAFTRAHAVDVSRADCTACHDPHAAGLRSLVRANRHKPFATGNCRACHGDAAADGSFGLTADVKSLCVRCHPVVQQFGEHAFHHNLDDEASCTNCHNPHAADGASLLIAEPAVLCMRCHFNDREKSKAAYVTHDGMDCTNCHLPHGADNRRYLKTLGVELCAGCHENAHRVSHPVGAEVIDKRTGEPLTCISCHRLHGADFAKYLPLDPSSDLCVQCHRR